MPVACDRCCVTNRDEIRRRGKAKTIVVDAKAIVIEAKPFVGKAKHIVGQAKANVGQTIASVSQAIILNTKETVFISKDIAVRAQATDKNSESLHNFKQEINN